MCTTINILVFANLLLSGTSGMSPFESEKADIFLTCTWLKVVSTFVKDAITVLGILKTLSIFDLKSTRYTAFGITYCGMSNVKTITTLPLYTWTAQCTGNNYSQRQAHHCLCPRTHNSCPSSAAHITPPLVLNHTISASIKVFYVNCLYNGKFPQV